MNEREICERIVRHGNCCGISCYNADGDCPFRCDDEVAMAKQWLKDNPIDLEFQRGEIIQVWDNVDYVHTRIFLKKDSEGFVCVSQPEDIEDGKEKFLSNRYNEITWDYAMKLKGEIVRPTEVVSEKPPLGIIPLDHFNRIRMQDLCRAINDYLQEDLKKECMQEWANELKYKMENYLEDLLKRKYDK